MQIFITKGNFIHNPSTSTQTLLVLQTISFSFFFFVYLCSYKAMKYECTYNFGSYISLYHKHFTHFIIYTS